MSDLRIKNGFDLDRVNAEALVKPKKLIEEYESCYDNTVSDLADNIISNKKKIVLLSGPSSSGKTTTSFKLKDEFRRRDVTAIAISLDNFFINKREAKKDERGCLDLESLNALDLLLLKKKMDELINKGSSFFPVFDFIAGVRTDDKQEYALGENGVAIVEGIHALNNAITDILPSSLALRLYISVHSDFISKGHKVLSKRNARLIRRLVRDFKFRGSSAENTLFMWPDVCEGEDKYIRPFAEYADIRLDTTFPYDCGILKSEAVRILSMVARSSPYFEKAAMLLDRLNHFKSFDLDLLPKSALLREFTGGGTYE